MDKKTGIFLGALLLVLLGGCGSAHIKVKGQLLKKGEPFIPGADEHVLIDFLAEEAKEGKENSYVVSFNPADGTFEVTGATGKGLLPGKYRVCVRVMKKKKDIFKGAFDAKNSPFVCTVETGKEELKFDVVKDYKAPPPVPAKGARQSRERRK